MHEHIRKTAGLRWYALRDAGPPHASLHAIDIPLRITYRAWRSVAPYMHLSYGIGILGLTGSHGAVDSSNPSFDDSTVVVLGHHLGFGIGSLFLLGDQLSIDASFSYRALFATSIDGVGLDGDIVGHGWILRAGPALSF